MKKVEIAMQIDHVLFGFHFIYGLHLSTYVCWTIPVSLG